MAKSLFSAGTFTRTFTGTQGIWWQRVAWAPEPLPEPKQSWWQRVSLAPEPVDRNQPITANHDGSGTGSLKRRNPYRNQEIMMAKGLFTAGTFNGTQEIMMAKGLFSAGTFTGTQEIMMAKGLWSAWTFTGTRKSRWQRASLPPKPLPEPKNSSWQRVSLAPEPLSHRIWIMMAQSLFLARI